MSGIDIRIRKLFRGKRRLVISALDHVMEYGDQDGLENIRSAITRCDGTDALLLSQYTLRRNWDLFTRPDAPTPIVRLNWSSAFYYPLHYRAGHTQIATSVEEAVSAGGEAVICSLFLENDHEEMEAKNVALFAEVVRRKERLGIPLIGECYVVEHNEKSGEEVHAKVKRVVRVMAELGADLIKCFYTGDRFSEIVENTPIPIFTIGAEKLDTDLAVLQKAGDSAKGGASGIIFGRNIFLATDPSTLIKALNAVLEDEPVEKAAARYGIV